VKERGEKMARTSNFIIMFNVVTLILGAIVFGMAVYTKQNFTDRWSMVLSTGAVWIGIFSGLFMMMISFLGCYAARKNKKALLCVYLICVCVILALQSGAAAVLINYAGRFRTVSTQVSDTLVVGDDIAVNNAVLSVFNYCCSGCDDAAVQAFTGSATGCSVSTPRFCNTTRQMEEATRLGRTWSPITCDNPIPCAAGADNCWKINDGSIPRGQLKYPPVSIDRTFCTLLMTISESGKPLVDFPQNGGCGNGKVAGFLNAVDSYFSPKMYYAGVVFALIAAIQGSVLVVGFYVICFVSKRDVMGDDD
jgi:hypothetical protein